MIGLRHYSTLNFSEMVQVKNIVTMDIAEQPCSKRQRLFRPVTSITRLSLYNNIACGIIGRRSKWWSKNRFIIKSCAPPGNRTRVARMGILHDTITLAAQLVSVAVFCSLNVVHRFTWLNLHVAFASQTGRTGRVLYLAKQ